MIKIQEHLNIENANEYLDSLALSMWEELNKVNKGGDFNHFSLIKKLDRLIDKTNEVNFIYEYSDGNTKTIQRQKSFLDFLFQDDYSKLKKLIISRPEELVILKSEIMNILTQADLFYDYQGGFKQTAFGNLLIEELFNYKNFRGSSFCRELMINVGFENVTCPYCNDNSVRITNISSDDDEDTILRAYFDLDHFFSKSQNPFFAISFYNLIPSCHDCNSLEKSDLIFNLETHIHPYSKSFNENYTFKINPDSIIHGYTDKINIHYIGDSEDFNKRDLKLEQRYKSHLDSINQFIKLYINYQNYRNSPNYSYDYSDALLINVPLNSHDILRKKTGKMYRDVLKEIDVFGLIE